MGLGRSAGRGVSVGEFDCRGREHSQRPRLFLNAGQRDILKFEQSGRSTIASAASSKMGLMSRTIGTCRITNREMQGHVAYVIHTTLK